MSITAAAGALASICTLIGVAATGWFGFKSKDEELRVELVQVAVGILKEPKATGEAQPRNWAIDLMEQSTGVKMNAQERTLLVDLGGLKVTVPREVAWMGACENGSRIVAYFDNNLQPSIAKPEPCPPP